MVWHFIIFVDSSRTVWLFKLITHNLSTTLPLTMVYSAIALLRNGTVFSWLWWPVYYHASLLLFYGSQGFPTFEMNYVQWYIIVCHSLDLNGEGGGGEEEQTNYVHPFHLKLNAYLYSIICFRIYRRLCNGCCDLMKWKKLSMGYMYWQMQSN